MFDIRKIQEQVIFGAVAAASDTVCRMKIGPRGPVWK